MEQFNRTASGLTANRNNSKASGLTANRNNSGWKEAFADLSLQMTEFASRLDVHSAKEEDLLFPMMAKRIGRTVGPIAVMEYEHDQAKKNLHLFLEGAQSGSGPENAEDATELADCCVRAYEILRDHFMKEEQVLFPLAQTMLTHEEVQELEEGFYRLDREQAARL
jgi:hemerythrin-like domain-containing protein